MSEGFTQVDRHLGPMLSALGFVPDGILNDVDSKERLAWAVFYRRDDCKLQICWSAREGSTDFMLAKPDVSNNFGLDDGATRWHLLLMLNDFEDGLATPAVDAGTEIWWRWRSLLFEAHFPGALRSLQQLK
jgi:hypothetical protein